MTPARGSRSTPPPEPEGAPQPATADPFERPLPAGARRTGRRDEDDEVATDEPPVAASAHANARAEAHPAAPDDRNAGTPADGDARAAPTQPRATRRPSRLVGTMRDLGPDERMATLVALAVSAIATIGGLILVIARAIGGAGGGWYAYQPLRRDAVVVTAAASGLAFWVGLILLVVGLLGLGILAGRLLARR